jgi:hypothetical protein
LAMASRVALWLSVSSNGAAGWFMSYCTTILNPIARHYTSTLAACSRGSPYTCGMRRRWAMPWFGRCTTFSPSPFAADEQARRYLLARADLIIALGALLRSGCTPLVLARSGQSPSGHSPTLAAKKDRERMRAALSVWHSAGSADAASVARPAARCRGAVGIVDQHSGPAHQSSLDVVD